MKTEQILVYFGGVTKTAIALNVNKSAISHWPEYPPGLRQIQVQCITDGFLSAEADCITREDPMQRRRRRETYRVHYER